eukprot:CAMPEP_0172615678 /NCGR_PEP_ID=MMETSP1068-20121228/61811_1 /TAXON_ID=35684 /ORGANISM="Pseudopedinella elastica, Strain CCMP716" /LENGTH=145 /DNA_ID=CAMNT_0013420895 /DNA_START=81 /DNA_END=518 /DNA_ORIENTATION=-
MSEPTDDEILELEERLAKLKRERELVESVKASEAMDSAAVQAPEPVSPVAAKFDQGTLSVRNKVANIKSAPPKEFVTEAWKEEEASGGSLVSVIGGVLLAVVLVVFAQIPVGNDVSVGIPANDGREQRLLTPEEIKAKYEAASKE